MTVKFGLGIENEVTFSFSDPTRKKRRMNVSQGSNRLTHRVGYRSSSAFWNERTGWSRREGNNDKILASGDPTVSGNDPYDHNDRPSGFEFQTVTSYVLNTKPREMVDMLAKALNEGALELQTSAEGYPLRKPNSFGVSPGFGYPKRFGSYHVNITMPYKTLGEDQEAYINKLFKGIKVIRAIQPLIIAMIGGADVKSVGNPAIGEGSTRQVYDGYGNIGNVTLDATFKRKLTSGSSYYKHGNSSPSFRGRLSRSIGGMNVSTPDVGDVVIKHYRNTNPYPTIEFRFLDPFYIPNLYPMLKVMISALEHGKNVGDITDGKHSEIWNEAMALVLEEGWNGRLPLSYAKFLKEKLKISIPVKDQMRADILFEKVTEELWTKNKNGFWVKTMFDEFAVPKVINLNRYNWDQQFRFKYLNNAQFRNYIDKFIATIHKIDASSSDGWIKVGFGGANKVGARDLLLDDERYGIDMATEDFEDVAFVLERSGHIQLKLNDVGHVVALKTTQDDPKKVMKALDALEEIDDIDTYFGQSVTHVEEAPEVEEVVEEEVPEVAEEPIGVATGVVTGLRSSDDVEIDMTQLQVTRIRVDDESSLYYNARDLREIFNVANFIDNEGNPYVVNVVTARIKYQDVDLNAFWTKRGRYVTVFISNYYDDEEPMSTLIGRLKRNFYSPRSVDRTNVWTSQLTVDEFFSRLDIIARQHYDKRSEGIALDRAGIESLKAKGIRIASLSRGQQYFIVNKKKFNLLKRTRRGEIRLINYIPYQRKYRVQKRGNTYNLLMDGKIIDSLGGE